MSAAKKSHRHAPDWLILSIACVAQFMVVLDVSVVNVALPHMGRDLSLSHRQLVARPGDGGSITRMGAVRLIATRRPLSIAP